MTAAAVVTAAITGIVKLRFRLAHDVLRHASNGPTPVSSSRKSAIGMFTRLKNGGPTVTLCPRIDSRKVQKISQTFHVFSMPRFSCIITECKNAVPVSHGKIEAFSTGSHPQYPPHPSTE